MYLTNLHDDFINENVFRVFITFLIGIPVICHFKHCFFEWTTNYLFEIKIIMFITKQLSLIAY